jgi:hypothetical protein
MNLVLLVLFFLATPFFTAEAENSFSVPIQTFINTDCEANQSCDLKVLSAHLQSS